MVVVVAIDVLSSCCTVVEVEVTVPPSVVTMVVLVKDGAVVVVNVKTVLEVEVVVVNTRVVVRVAERVVVITIVVRRMPFVVVTLGIVKKRVTGIRLVDVEVLVVSTMLLTVSMIFRVVVMVRTDVIKEVALRMLTIVVVVKSVKKHV